MNKTLFRTLLSCAVLGPVLLSSCSENDDIWDPYYNWKNRNAAWYETIADSARTAISTAKSRYGEDWEKHCDWRMIKTYKKGADAAATLEDSICVHILTRGQGQYSAAFTDSVSLNFRGWTMPTEYLNENGDLEFHGRKDRQIKHMGHRIELGEIESTASEIAGVDACCALYHKEKELLYLFYTGDATSKQIVLHFRSVLPAFMVPRKLVQLDMLPCLPNGKLDMTTLKTYFK